ncbi:hypothetical protein FOA43_001694 [Brettanomyces nanus]|uniref:TAFII28-like protein domain-containing protein n=1 Tax=Eeniella nana TaxID=13502 RepID=A0A875RUA7_EENNA|nr:uncharacterized protein FOA43_001694 [Brettanomyces nanus]QPG74367.1 hypothetical protein FOA43_001694 [Brettanomyces nanus]
MSQDFDSLKHTDQSFPSNKQPDVLSANSNDEELGQSREQIVEQINGPGQERKKFSDQLTAEDVLNYDPSGSSDTENINLGPSLVSNDELQQMVRELEVTKMSLSSMNSSSQSVPKKRKYTKRNKDLVAPKKPRKIRKTKQSVKNAEEMYNKSGNIGPVLTSLLTTNPTPSPPVAAQAGADIAATTFRMAPRAIPDRPVAHAGTYSQSLEARMRDIQKMYIRKTPEPERAQPLDPNGVPIDMVKAMDYLQERFEDFERVNLSEKLLAKKKEEDEGVEEDIEDESGEEFEDLLDLFDIDPDQTSLDIGLNDRRNLLLESMDEAQLSRYEFFRRTNLNSGNIRKFVSSVIGQNIHGNLVKIIGGVGKVFVGEVVEKAKDVQRKENDAKVIEQLDYKRKLKGYENMIQHRKERGKSTSDVPKPASPPTYYESLRESANYPKRSPYTYNNFRVLIPSESEPLTPNHIREAWRLYRDENNTVINGRWRQQGGGNGLMFR